MPKDKNKIALSLDDIKKLLDSDNVNKKKKKRKKKKKDKYKVKSEKRKQKGITFDPIKHGPNIPTRTMSWNGPSQAMRQDDVLRGDINKLNNKLAFSSDPQEIKQLKDQITNLQANQLPPGISPEILQKAQSVTDAGGKITMLSNGVKITMPKKDIKHRKAKDVTDLIVGSKPAKKTSLFETNDGKGDFSQSRFLPKQEPPNTLTNIESRVEDLSELPMYNVGDNIDVPASQWIDTYDDSQVAEFPDVSFDDDQYNDQGVTLDETIDEADNIEFKDESHVYDYYDAEGNIIPPEDLHMYNIADSYEDEPDEDKPEEKPVKVKNVKKLTKPKKIVLKTYTCPECGKEYKYEARLIKHMESKH